MAVSSAIINLIKAAFAFIKNIVKKIVSGILSFAAHVVGWFKNLSLNPNKDVPFLADAEKFKDMLKTAPVKNVGLFEGVYDEQADEITYNQMVEADELDDQTRKVLGNEPLVILS